MLIRYGINSIELLLPDGYPISKPPVRKVINA